MVGILFLGIFGAVALAILVPMLQDIRDMFRARRLEKELAEVQRKHKKAARYAMAARPSKRHSTEHYKEAKELERRYLGITCDRCFSQSEREELRRKYPIRMV